ncbi:MAG: C39 family peptidase [Chloroflexota bacterium]
MISRPTVPIHLSIPHIQQKRSGECLAACAAMVIEHLNQHVTTTRTRRVRYTYRQLIRMLQIKRTIGTPFSQITRLDRLNINIHYQTHGRLETLYELLRAGWPSIVGVQTQELPHWQGVYSKHVLVVVGMDAQNILANDPEFPDAPIAIPLGDFDLAWLEQNEPYAVLSSKH